MDQDPTVGRRLTSCVPTEGEEVRSIMARTTVYIKAHFLQSKELVEYVVIKIEV